MPETASAFVTGFQLIEPISFPATWLEVLQTVQLYALP